MSILFVAARLESLIWVLTNKLVVILKKNKSALFKNLFLFSSIEKNIIRRNKNTKSEFVWFHSMHAKELYTLMCVYVWKVYSLYGIYYILSS